MLSLHYQKTAGQRKVVRRPTIQRPANNQITATGHNTVERSSARRFFHARKEVTPVAKGTITMQIENFQKLLGTIAELDEAGRKAIKNTVKDVKARAPGWIASEVVTVYNIKKGEITPSSSKTAKPKKMAGTIRVAGETIEELTITYEGRMLTPVHFGMTPKSPPAGRSYTLKMQVVKGQKKVIGRYLNTRTPGGPYSQRSHNILMGTGNTKAGGVGSIPFQRQSPQRSDITKFTAISMPQMITSDKTADKIKDELQAETLKRLEHNINRALGK